jgi:hypothetical protein
VPDYVSLFKDCIELARYYKEEWAQLQFTFESVEICVEYPTGVKTTYRVYTQNCYIEIIEDEQCEHSVCGLIPQECVVQTRPLPGEPPVIVLKKFPTADVNPAPFIEGSRELVAAVAQQMISQHCRNSQSTVAPQWECYGIAAYLPDYPYGSVLNSQGSRLGR